MRAHVLRNTLISILVALFSITATGCGRQALSPIPPQNPIQPEKKITEKKIPMMEKTLDLIFSDLTLLFIGVGTAVWADNKPKLLYPDEASIVQHAAIGVVSLATIHLLMFT